MTAAKRIGRLNRGSSRTRNANDMPTRQDRIRGSPRLYDSVFLERSISDFVGIRSKADYTTLSDPDRQSIV